jgi:hypothetical protein
MVTNFYNSNYDDKEIQDLYESLIEEAFQMYGQDMYYILRTYVNKDELYEADDVSEYNSAYLMEFYIKSIDGFSGDGNFMSKFGVEIRDTIIFSVSRKRFMEEIGDEENIPRPREGDLVYFPLNNKCFEIKYVDNKPIFYQGGELYVFDLHCELFEYSSENFNTGIPEIDSIHTTYSMDVLDHANNELFDTTIADPLHNNEDVQTESNNIIDFTEMDPMQDGAY